MNTMASRITLLALLCGACSIMMARPASAAISQNYDTSLAWPNGSLSITESLSSGRQITFVYAEPDEKPLTYKLDAQDTNLDITYTTSGSGGRKRVKVVLSLEVIVVHPCTEVETSAIFDLSFTAAIIESSGPCQHNTYVKGRATGGYKVTEELYEVTNLRLRGSNSIDINGELLKKIDVATVKSTVRSTPPPVFLP